MSEIALLLALAGVARVAIAAEPGGTATQIEAPPPKPGADGWYDARPIDESFVVRIPAIFQSFAEKGTTEGGEATYTVGVRARAPAAFGGVTSYVASCIEQPGDDRPLKERLEEVIDRWKRARHDAIPAPDRSGARSRLRDRDRRRREGDPQPHLRAEDGTAARC